MSEVIDIEGDKHLDFVSVWVSKDKVFCIDQGGDHGLVLTANQFEQLITAYETLKRYTVA